MASPCAGRTIRERFALPKAACRVLLLALLAVIAAPALSAAQTLLTSAPAFPRTSVGNSVTKNFVITVNSGGHSVVFNSIALGPGFTDFKLGTITGCVVDGATANPDGAVCTVPVTFAPTLPGRASAPAPIARSAPLLISDVENGVPHQYAFALSGSGTTPLPVVLPGIIADSVGNDLAAMNDQSATPGFAGDGGPASGAVFNRPASMAVDAAGNIYISDTGNCVVRRVDKLSQTINTVAGVAQSCGSGVDGVAATASMLSGNTGIALDTAGNLYIVDSGNNVVRQVSAATGLIQTVAGTLNTAGYGGDNGLAVNALLNNPGPIAVDGYGNLFLGDTGNQAVRKVQAGTGIITTIATSVLTQAVAVDSVGNIYISDGNSAAILRVDAVTQALSTWSNLSGFGTYPSSLAVDASDTLHFTLVSECGVFKLPQASNLPIVEAGAGDCLVGNFSGPGDGGAATLAGLNLPVGVVVDGTGSFYILEAEGVRFVDSTGTQLTPVQFGTVVLTQFGSISPLTDPTSTQNIQLFNGDIPTDTGSTPNPLAISFKGLGPPFAAVPVPSGQDCSAATTTFNVLINPAGFCTLSIAFGSQLETGIAAQTSFYETPATGIPVLQTLNLNGVGGTPVVTLSPASLTFLNSVGVTTPPQTLTLTNNMPNSIAITQISSPVSGGFTVAGLAQTSNCPALLPGNSSCTIVLTYTPPAGRGFGELQVYYQLDPLLGSYNEFVQAEIEGDGFNGGGNLNPVTISFGQQAVGSTSSPIAIQLNSTGAPPTYTWPLAIDSMSLGGKDAAQFAISGTTCGNSVAVGSACTIYVVFKPLTATPMDPLVGIQPFEATLTIAYNSGKADPLSASLSGIGTGNGTSPLNISETIHLSETPTLILAIPFPIKEAIHLSDAGALVLPTPFTITEAIHLSDAAGLTAPTPFAITEAIHLSDLAALVLPTPLTVAETIHLSDRAGVITPTPLTISEAIRVSEGSALLLPTLFAITETIQVGDAAALVAPTPLAILETVHLADAARLVTPTPLAISEAIHLGDLPTLTVPTPLAIAEAIHLGDRTLLVIPTPLIVAETIHLTESPAILQPLLVPLTETVHLTDSLQSVPSLLVPIAETVHILDAPAVVPSLLVPIAEMVHVLDTPRAIPSLLVTIGETVRIVDMPDTVLSVLVSIGEVIHVVDAPAILSSLSVPVAETVHVADTPSILESISVPVTEILHVMDGPVTIPSLLVPIAETILVTDKPITTPSLVVPVLEAIHLLDSPAAAPSLLVPITEIIRTKDTPVTIPSLAVPVLETVLVTDSPAILLPLQVPVVETIHLLESPAATPSLLVPITEIIRTTDTLVTIPSLAVPVVETVHVTDSPTMLLPLQVPVAETILITDEQATILSLVVPVVETIHLLDSPAVAPSLLIPILETIHTTDTLVTIRSLVVPVVETIYLVDSPAVTPSLLVPILETIHATDTPVTIPSLLVPVIETIHLLDSPAVTPSLLVPILETIRTTDSLVTIPSLEIPVVETIHFSDGSVILLPLQVPILETIVATDTPVTIPSLLVPITETIRLTDTPATQTPATSTVNFSPQASIVYGATLAGELTATATSNGSPVAGSFIYTAALAGGNVNAVASSTVLNAGIYTLTAIFAPVDPALFTATVANAQITVTPAPLTVVANDATRTYGTPNPPLSGTAKGAVNGDIVTVSATTTATQASNAGKYAVVPSTSGSNLSDYAVTLVNGTLTITPAATATSIASSDTDVNLNAPVTLTATVTPAAMGTPGGVVNFLDGSASLGTGTLTAQGTASLTTTALTAGTHLIVASYAGDANFTGSDSSVLLESVVAPDFNITVAPSTLTIKQGGSGSAVFTITPVGGFSQPIAFSCANVPSNATCTFTPSTLTPNGVPLTSTLTITTSTPNAQRILLGSTPAGTPSLAMVLYSSDAGCGAGLLLVFLRRRKKTINPGLLGVVWFALLLTAVGTLAGCGTHPPPGTPIGTDTMTVSASTSIAGGPSHSVTLTVVITQ